MSQKLKPCPFCGGKAQLIEQWIQDPLGRPRVDCSVCRVGFDYIHSQKTLIKLWNSRHNEETPRERFRREYRETRLLSRISKQAMIRGSTRTALYSFRAYDIMERRSPLPFRLADFKDVKRGGYLWT